MRINQKRENQQLDKIFPSYYIYNFYLFLLSKMESAAVSILTKAVEKDKKKQYKLAFDLYQEGLAILIESIKPLTDPVKKKHLQNKATDYFGRAEHIKKILEKREAAGQCRIQTKIEAGSIGNGYSSVFGRYLDDSVTRIDIEDPYIRTHHQCMNLVRLCELAIRNCKSLTKVSLVTTHDMENDGKNQIKRLEELKRSLEERSVEFHVTFSDTLHDRQILLDNDWMIKIGRGLDYFKPAEGKFVLGACDMELRPCLETTVDIFQQSDVENN